MRKFDVSSHPEPQRAEFEELTKTIMDVVEYHLTAGHVDSWIYHAIERHKFGKSKLDRSLKDILVNGLLQAQTNRSTAEFTSDAVDYFFNGTGYTKAKIYVDWLREQITDESVYLAWCGLDTSDRVRTPGEEVETPGDGDDDDYVPSAQLLIRQILDKEPS